LQIFLTGKYKTTEKIKDFFRWEKMGALRDEPSVLTSRRPSPSPRELFQAMYLISSSIFYLKVMKGQEARIMNIITNLVLQNLLVSNNISNAVYGTLQKAKN
jgi:hypothetical protein